MDMPAIDTARAMHLGLAEVKASLSSVVSRVEQTGEPVVLMRYSRPAAIIVPVPQERAVAAHARGLLAEYADEEKLEQEGGAFARAMVAKHAR